MDQEEEKRKRWKWSLDSRYLLLEKVSGGEDVVDGDVRGGGFGNLVQSSSRRQQDQLRVNVRQSVFRLRTKMVRFRGGVGGEGTSFSWIILEVSKQVHILIE